jgi:hypothetical protein
LPFFNPLLAGLERPLSARSRRTDCAPSPAGARAASPAWRVRTAKTQPRAQHGRSSKADRLSARRFLGRLREDKWRAESLTNRRRSCLLWALVMNTTPHKTSQCAQPSAMCGWRQTAVLWGDVGD